MSTDPSDDDFERYLDPVAEAEIERLKAERSRELPPRVRLDPDLEKVEAQIAHVAIQRRLGDDEIEPCMFGRFEALTSLRGGMGLVIKARDRQLERDVAIKLWMRSGPEARAALLAEAKTLAQLKHPNVVTVYEPGFWKDDRVYFVMEWIEGVDGHQWMDRPRAWREVLDVYIPAGIGLAAAHEVGIQHRDFKPPNILIGDDGRVVVADFGVADSLHSLPEFDEPGRIVGTPSYMAPERLLGERGDARSDQFSFCVAMWRSLYQQRPYAGATGDELLESIVRGEIREAPGVDVPPWLSAVVRKGLAADPDQRYRSMHELLGTLSNEPPTEKAESEPVADLGQEIIALASGREPARKPRRWPYLLAAFVSSASLLTGFVAVDRSAVPEQSAVDIQPYHAILGLVVADEFIQATELWRASTLTDAESLRIADECMNRAKQLEGVDPAKADQAVWMAHDVATDVLVNGDTPEARAAGSRTAAAAMARSNGSPQTED